jgi:hypothetical protein
MARAINQQGGVFEDLLEILKTKYNTVVTPGDVAMLKADVDKAASNPTNNP